MEYKIIPNETPSKAALLEFATSAAVADSEADVASMLLTFAPVYDRAMMSAAYESALGYNPITAFDKKDIERIVDEMAMGPGLAGIFDGKKEEIIDRAMDIFEDCRDTNLRICVATAARQVLGDVSEAFADATQGMIDDAVANVSLQSKARRMCLMVNDGKDDVDMPDDDEEDEDEESVDLFELDDDMSSFSEPVEGEEFLFGNDEDDDDE